jgi:hypothetical protein
MNHIGKTVEYKGRDGKWHTGTVVKHFKRYGTLQLDVNGSKAYIAVPLGGNPNSRFAASE